MNLTEIEIELERLAPEELRKIALEAWKRYAEKEASGDAVPMCDEDDPDLLVALDSAVLRADESDERACSGSELRVRIDKWISG